MVGMTAALIGSAVIGGGASILASKSNRKAANRAADIEANASREANALTERIYDRNVGYLSPHMATGQVANNAFMELLGYPQAAPAPSAFASYAPVASSPYAFEGGGLDGRTPNNHPADMAWGPQMITLPSQGAFAFGSQQYGAPQPAAGTVTAAPSARSAFDTYRGSTGYDFRFNEGTRALQSAFSHNLESGAASKAAMRFGQGIASDEFGRYMDLLRGQSQMGFGAASALAGVGQNFGNTVNASNRLAADAAANARLYAGQQNAAMWQGLGSSFGTALGAFSGGGMPGFKVGGW